MGLYEKRISSLESMLEKLEAGEKYLEEEEYIALREEAKEIDSLAKKYPRLKDKLKAIRDRLRDHVEIIKNLILIVDSEIIETKEDIEAAEYIPGELMSVLEDIKNKCSEEFTRLSDLALNIYGIEEDIDSLPIPEKENLISICEIIRKNSMILLRAIRDEKNKIYKYELNSAK